LFLNKRISPNIYGHFELFRFLNQNNHTCFRTSVGRSIGKRQQPTCESGFPGLTEFCVRPAAAALAGQNSSISLFAWGKEWGQLVAKSPLNDPIF
jgi:hypothetical protein